MPGSTAAFPHLIGSSIYGEMLGKMRESFSLRNGDSFTVRDTLTLDGDGSVRVQMTGAGGGGGSGKAVLVSREAIDDAPGLRRLLDPSRPHIVSGTYIDQAGDGIDVTALIQGDVIRLLSPARLKGHRPKIAEKHVDTQVMHSVEGSTAIPVDEHWTFRG